MKRKELRSGMTIETQEGELGLIVKTDLELMVLFVESAQWEPVKDYRKDLTHKMHQELDVVRVYSPTSGHQIIPFHAKSGSLMFDRVEIVLKSTIGSMNKKGDWDMIENWQKPKEDRVDIHITACPLPHGDILWEEEKSGLVIGKPETFGRAKCGVEFMLGVKSYLDGESKTLPPITQEIINSYPQLKIDY